MGLLVTLGTLVQGQLGHWNHLLQDKSKPLGPLMQGLLETPGLTVAGHLGHGQVNKAPKATYARAASTQRWASTLANRLNA
jgi:hypothetical protein